MDVQALETPRLRLRAWREDDLEPYAAIVADPEVMRSMGSGPMSTADARAQVERFAAGTAVPGVYHTAAELRATGELIGRIGLFHHPELPEPDRVEVGWLLTRAHWGHGYATEGGAAALGLAFGPLALARVVSFTQPMNAPSRAVMERLGMTLRRHFTWAGLPHVLYALDRPEPAIP